MKRTRVPFESQKYERHDGAMTLARLDLIISFDDDNCLEDGIGFELTLPGLLISSKRDRGGLSRDAGAP